MNSGTTQLPAEKCQRAIGATLRLVLAYALFASLWILLSDKAVAWLFTNSEQIILVSMLKGWLFVAVTSLLLYGLVQRLIGQLRTLSRRENDAQTENARIQQLLAAIVDSSTDAIYAKDLAGRYLLFNREAAQITGQSPELAQGRDDTALFPAAQAALIRADDQRVIASNQIMQSEDTLSTANGERIFLSTKGPLQDSAGKVIGLFGISRDITERKQEEERLRIAAIAFESQEGMFITDAARVILRVNHAFSEITGYSADEAVGQTPHLLDSGRHDAAFFAVMAECIQRTGGWQGEIWNRRKNGEVYPEWLTTTAVKDAAGVVSHYVDTLTDITFRKEAEDEIKNLAFYDPLTHLPNRRLIFDFLAQSLVTSARRNRHGALLLIDLDNFKTLNDTLGHNVGDQLLLAVSARLKSATRDGDTVARLGGDEFVVILENLDESGIAAMQAENVARKIHLALNQPYLLDLGLTGECPNQRSHHCTSSIGITLFRDHPDSVEDLMKRADTAMYQAKAAGRNTMRFFDPDMEAAVNARAALEIDLRQAIVEQQFALYYQAQVDAAGQITGAEALLRWQHPAHDVVPSPSPSCFIPLAEETALILPLGQWVMDAACTQLAAWATQPAMAHLTLAVNVSANQFRLSDFVEQVLATLDLSGANPQRLKLELTESLLVEDVEDVIEKMTALKARGVSFSLDDFGTGYSSLAYLKRLPLDQLKIDQSFVHDVLTDANDAAIARTIVALGQSLGLGVIAEGVETEAQRDFLASNGCLAYQGYFFSRPLPLADFEAFVQRV